ncbi:MAG TPA: response regulator transcription factor [Azospirillaceae bacterium]|nr:response regulator transcription factor [Azospirillaceae bacterium]
MRKLLVIEDDGGTRELLIEELSEAGFEVLPAVDGRAGLEAMLRHRPDLVLCDIAMPVRSGFDLLRALVDGHPELADIPFVFLTAFADRETELAGRRLGADDFVTKPIDFDLLVEVVRARLSGSTVRAARSPVQLSDREAEALTWVARGKSSGDAAVLMNVAERTVNFHVENAMRKLGVGSRVQAALAAARIGLIRP